MQMYSNPTGQFTVQEKRYMDYINDHVAKVRKSFDERIHVFERVMNLSSNEMQELLVRIGNHDMSKYSVNEFPQYRNWFYPEDGEAKNSEAFSRAWAHHCECNDHHPEHWVKNNVPMTMSRTAMVEMILDWEAMSRTFGGNPKTWYNQSGKNLPFSNETRSQVVTVLNIVYTEDMNLKEYRPPILG